VTTVRETGAVLGELSSAGTPWLAIDLAGPASRRCLALSAGDATLIDIADPHAVPVTVNPLQPGPGYPIQAHADRVAGLFEAAFGPAEPVAAAIRAGLQRTYTNCGWDPRTGAALPGAVAPPTVPAFRQLRTGVMAAATDLGYSQSRQADVRGFLRTRLDVLWAGPAGRFLEGGHPVDVGSLLSASVLVTNSGVADDEAVSFLAGVLLVRLAEQLGPGAGIGGPRGSHTRGRTQARHDQHGRRFTVVIGTAGAHHLGRGQEPGWLEVVLSWPERIIVPAALTSSSPGQAAARLEGLTRLAGSGDPGSLRRCCSGADRRPAASGAGAGHATGTSCTRPLCSHTTTGGRGCGYGSRHWCSRSSRGGRCHACPRRCDRAGRRSARAAASACWRP
jgi:hypothetical protein